MNAHQLLVAHLDRLTADPERWLELFADDAVVEFPYAAGLAAPARLAGREAIGGYFFGARPNFEGLAFTDPRHYPGADPDVALVEVHGSARLRSTGRRYEQDYVMLARARAGRIALYREYWNPLPVIEAFSPGVKA